MAHYKILRCLASTWLEFVVVDIVWMYHSVCGVNLQGNCRLELCFIFAYCFNEFNWQPGLNSSGRRLAQKKCSWGRAVGNAYHGTVDPFSAISSQSRRFTLSAEVRRIRESLTNLRSTAVDPSFFCASSGLASRDFRTLIACFRFFWFSGRLGSYTCKYLYTGIHN